MTEFAFEGESYERLHEKLSDLRRNAPMFYWKDQDCWVVSRYADIFHILTDSRFTVEGQTSSLNAGFCAEAKAIIKEGVDWLTVAQVNNVDGPVHIRLRSVLQKLLAPARLAILRPKIAEVAHRLVDRIAARGECDLIEAFLAPFTFEILLELLDIEASEEERAHLLPCSDSLLKMFTAILTPAEQVVAASQAVELQMFVRNAFRARRESPRDDVLTAIVGQLDDGTLGISEDELTMLFAFSLFVAGHETTKSMIANIVRQLLLVPEQWQALSQNEGEGTVRAVVEEMLRLDGVVAALTRYPREPVTIAGVSVPAGARLVMMIPSANHDEAKFDAPADFCPARGVRNGQLTFGAGSHFCVGAPLARIEMEIALAVLTKRLPGLRLRPDQMVEYEPSFILRGLRSLRVEWDVPSHQTKISVQ